MIAHRGQPMRRASDKPSPRPIHRSGNPDFVELVIDDPHILLERGQVLFAEGDRPSCMYIVKSGALQIRSGSVIYEDVRPGGIVGEMGLVEKYELRSATVYALTDSELVEIDEARFSSLVAQVPSFAIEVMRVLSRRLRMMDRRYRPSH
jgi:CRP/FNR family transcriptional regulator, cyclic AMP receptor protein